MEIETIKRKAQTTGILQMKMFALQKGNTEPKFIHGTEMGERVLCIENTIEEMDISTKKMRNLKLLWHKTSKNSGTL